ncbi:MAG: hypothetical protein MK236_10275, partial [Pedosphaera sp.]|nr:hypothetical protein [Pedosphaera sp.]
MELQWKGPGFDWMALSSVVDQPGPLPPVAMSVAGALTWNGSFIAHAVEGLAESRVRFSGKPQNIRLSTVNTSAIFFQPISLPHANRIRAGRVGRIGVLLNRGDFQEGEIKLIKDNVVTIKTLLFGEKSYQTGSEALAVFLQKPVRSRKEWTVRTIGGSEIKLQEMKWDKGMLVVRRSPFRNLRLKSADHAEISYGTTPNILHRAWKKWDAMTESERSHTRAQQAAFDRHHRSRANIRAQLVAIQVRMQAANEKLKEVGKSETAALAEVEVCEKLVYTTRAKWELVQAKRVVQLAVRDDRQQAFDYAKAVLAIKKANHITANQNLKNAKKQEKVQTELAMKTHAALLASNAKQVVADEVVFIKATEAFAKARIAYMAELNKSVKAAAMELAASKLTATKASTDKSAADKALVTMKSKLAMAQNAYTDAETASKVAVTKVAVATVATTKAKAALTAAVKDVTGKSATAVTAKK